MSMAVGLEVRVPFCDHRLVEYLWNVPWSIKSAGGLKALLKSAMADVLPPLTLSRKKSAYPHFRDPKYHSGLVREATEIVQSRRSLVAQMFNADALKDFITEVSLSEATGTTRWSFPGGASPAYMLIHLVEINRWIEDYRVSV
jgi:asparagine synthetase B (glutamine-hydrolysing)